jgi:predicted nuclease of predicted toxin-antitoxin system
MPEGTAEGRADLKRKVRILVDQSLGRGVADLLRDGGYNAVFAGDVGLEGKDDNAVASYAWRDNRMIWTHDADFLDDRLLPEHRNPGVVVLPGGDGDQCAMNTGLAVAVTVFGHSPETWKQTKSTISPTGEMTIRSRKRSSTGAVTSTRYRMTDGEFAEIWVDD